MVQTYLGHDVLVVVIAQGSTQLVVVHVGLAFSLAPSARYFIRVSKLELTGSTVPRDATSISRVRQQLQ